MLKEIFFMLSENDTSEKFKSSGKMTGIKNDNCLANYKRLFSP